MVEYVADADECDQKPYEERNKETSPESKVGEKIPTFFFNGFQQTISGLQG